MSSYHTITRFVFALGVLGFTACSSTDYFEEDPPITHQPLRIVTATTPIEVEATPVKQEMINTYTLLYVNTTTRRVEAIQNVDKQDKGVEYDQVSFPIEISDQGGVDYHNYKVYAFANFTPEMKAATKLDLTSKTLAQVQVGDVLTEYFESSINSATLDLTGLNGHDFTQGTQYIPMTAVVDYDATMQYHQPVNVPLVRMLAKLDYKITNRLGAQIEIENITMRPAYNKPVYLLPHIKGEEVGFYPERPASAEELAKRYIPQLPVAPTTETDTKAVTLACSGPTATIASDGFSTFRSMYVNESLSQWHPTGHFTYDVVLTVNGEKRQYRYALSADDFTAFCRNDHVTIPLVITSPSSLEPEVLFYPPIGGYPPVITDKNDNEFYATFSTPGDFAIYPHIYREGTRTDIRLTDKNEVEFSVAADHMDENNDPCTIDHLTVTGDDIFAKQPRYNAGDNCIKATLGSAKGHAIITLTVKMLDSNQIVSKKMHIIRE